MTNIFYLKGSALSEISGDSASCGEWLHAYVYESFSHMEAPLLVEKCKVINLSGYKKENNLWT